VEKLLKKGHYGIITQLHSIQAIETPSPTFHPGIQSLFKHQFVFDNPQGLPPSLGAHDHSIPLVPDSIPPNVLPYRHLFTQKNEIKKIVQELLAVGVIYPSTNPYSSPVVMVLKKQGTWCMFLDFCTLNKITIKYKFPILFIDDLLDELSGAWYFTKLDLCSSYHQTHMKDANIPKPFFKLMRTIMSSCSCPSTCVMHLPLFKSS
jgi:hypothetical protein